MEKHFIPTLRTGKFYSNLGKCLKNRSLTYYLHGYGQLAQYFYDKFQPIESKTTLIVPEALQRFYLSGYNGRVGASWMTREDRENDIDDYITYLNNIHHKVLKLLPEKPLEITGIGFSQGVTTLLRWIHNGQIKPQRVIMFSGGVPEEYFIKCNIVAFKNISFHLIFDPKDSLLTQERIDKTLGFFTTNNINHTTIHHSNAHNIDVKLLKKLY